MKIILNKKIYLFTIAFMLYMPNITNAASIYFDSDQNEFFVGDTIILNVRLDTQDKNINVIEGDININCLDKQISLSDISISDSVFSLWPRKPSISLDSKIISFTGGVPDGVNSKNATIFKIILNLKETGKIVFKPNNISVYLNDGNGSKDNISLQDFEINVLPKPTDYKSYDVWQETLNNDHTSPEGFKIYFGQDDSVYDGKKFLYFNAVDKTSDIKYYEVQEGDLDSVRSGSTYVIQEQEKQNKIKVTAYDLSGNAKTETYDPNKKSSIFWYVTIVLIAIISFSVFILKKKNRNGASL